ncbi:MAG: hypothetical protein KIT72_19605 [Polyangiaceae bacterium]|nr:hypothetical protein [Polyangiaceae bacterium]MCW5792628.1 hypothetical protein [Polyangiaceae bacterium]
MRSRAALLFVGIQFVGLTGCGGEQPSPAGAPDAAPEAEAGALAPAWELSFESAVGAGEEDTLCQYFVVPPGGLWVQRFEHTLSDRSHHLLLLPTALSAEQIPAPGVIHACGEGSPLKHTTGGVLYGGQPGGTSVSFPDGSALRLEAGRVVLLEHHVVNTGSAPIATRASLKLVSAVAVPEREAGIMHFYNWAIFVPPRGEGRAEMTCEVGEDVELSFGHGHMHERGTLFLAEIVEGNERAPLFETRDWDAETVSFGEARVRAGSHIRFGCSYRNSDDVPYFQGQSATTDEMCSLTLGYVSQSGRRLANAYEWCTTHASGVVGVGQLSCQAVDRCSEDAWRLARAGQGDGSGSALQTCFNQGCDSAPRRFRALSLCRAARCEAACGVAPGSGGLALSARDDAACVACLTQSCATEQAACDDAC